MPPSKSHEDAVEIIKESLKEEYMIDDNSFMCNISGFFKRLRPDIFFKNPKTGKYVVIEVGSTHANKFGEYLKMKHIEEIRWYTKLTKDGVKLVGQWETDSLHKVNINRKFCGFRLLDKELKERTHDVKKELREIGLYMDSYVCCSGCGIHMQIRQSSFMQYYGRRYVVCGTCNNQGIFNTVGDGNVKTRQ